MNKLPKKVVEDMLVILAIPAILGIVGWIMVFALICGLVMQR